MAVTVDKLEKLYGLVLDDRELTTSLLNDIGFNQDDLQELLEKEIIKTIEKGIYALIGVNGLYHYGKGLLFERRILEATEVFYKCHEIDPMHISTCFKLFYSKIKKGEYYESLEYFEVFFNNGDSFHKTDGNLFLYLLNLIINIPEKYKEHLSTLNFEDLKTKADDMRVKNMEFENTVRRYIFENKFYEALEALVNNANFNKFLPVQRAIVVNLLKQIIKNKEELTKAVVAEEISQKAEEKNKIHWLKSFMASQRKYLVKSGISFLPKEDSEKVICLADLMAKYYPQIELIIINDRDNCHCVLRNVDISRDMAVVKDLMDLADQNFILENFSEAKKIYSRLLHFETVEPIVYERLGIIHSKNILNEPAFIAFRFLDLARHFYKKKELSEKEQNLSDLMQDLKESNTRNNQYNFEGSTYCETIDIKKITDYIIASGLEDIDSACEELGMTPEQIDTLKLTYAREYYSQGDLTYGDAMLKAFEHSPNKTEYTKSLYRDVMKNRNYYANRRDPDAPILERGLKPRKNVQPK